MSAGSYAKMKDSGVEWLGEIPEHWEASRLKFVARFGYGDSLAAEDRISGDFDVYGSNGIVGQHDTPNTKGPSLIVGRKGSFGKVAYSEKPCFAIDTTYFIDARLTQNNLCWLFYCLQWLRLDSFSKDSAVPGLAREDAYENVVPFCFPDEQRAIATFLDREAARIDTLIGKKQRQIELLQEKRTALISHAVTKGLNPKAKMKDSGIEWLGEIPAHWDAVPVKWQYEIQLGKMLQNNPSSESDISVPYIKALYVLWGKVDTSDLPDMWASPVDLKQFRVKSGDLLVCEGGEAGRAGIVDTAPVTCIIQNALHRVREKGADVHYLQYVLQTVSSEGWFDVLCNKATIAHFTREKLANLRMPLPPSLEEQRAITSFLNRETERIDALIEKVKESIATLREYRAALISAAVTGKIDVREESHSKGLATRNPLKIREVDPMGRLHKQAALMERAMCSPVLESSEQLERVRRAMMPFGGAVEQALKMSEYTRQHQEFINSIAGITKASEHVVHVALASQRWFDFIERARLQTDAFKQISQMHSSWQEATRPLRDMTTSIRETTMPLMEAVSRNMIATERLLASVDLERLNKRFTLPKTIISQFSNDLVNLSESYGNLANSIGSIPDLVEIPKLALPGASRELLTNSYAISTIDVEAQAEVEVGDLITEGEKEVADLPDLLRSIDPALLKLYIGAKEALASGNTDRARHVLISLRELTTQILHRLAPDAKVHEWIPIGKEEEYLHNYNPKRKTRVFFICRDIMHGPLVEFIQKDSEIVSAFFGFLDRVHVVDPNMTDKQLKALILRIESWISYIIGIWKESAR